jgi:protein O-mannosyl-transferase
LACAMACLSNAVAAVIPMLIVVADLLILDRDKLSRIVRGTSALWAIGVATIVLKKMGDATDPTVAEFGVFSYQRLLVILNVYWLNLKTLAWPGHLTIDYWNVAPAGFAEPGVILGALAIGLTLALIYILWWKLLPRTALLGILWFGIALGPTSQIMPHHIDRADRFLYLPLVGLVLALGILLRPLGVGPKRRLLVPAAILLGASILLVLNTSSARQIRVWQSSLTLWEDCLELIPQNAFAHSCLAEALADEGRFPEAIEHYETALRIAPNNVLTLGEYAQRLAVCRQKEYRDYPLAIALAEQGCRLSEWKDPTIRRTLATAQMNFATALRGERQFERAMDHYHRAIESDPNYEVPLFNLAILLATCDDETLRRPREAVHLAERACSLVEPPNSVQLSVLAKVYAQTGQSEKATATIQKAIQQARDGGDLKMVGQLQGWLKSHRQSVLENR